MPKNVLRICKWFNKDLNKRLYLLIIIFSLCAHSFAHNGMLSGEKDLRLAKTKWFDIIYPARCEESASILYEKADAVYEEVTAQYGLEPSFRMPVVLTPAVDSFNAFWAAVPYNHIAIYDTGSSGAGELAVFSEPLLSTFRHELTHAVTYNMKNGFWTFIGKVFGDCVAPGMLTVTSGMAEGATVTSESAAGEGRLNDEYAKHYVKQAKIEDKFPSYHDVSGAADAGPGGAPYYFNGAFHQWLQDKYGMEAYANFWFRVVNGKNFTIAGAFKKAFGIKLKKAWAQFEEDYEVPDLAANPVEAGLARDFFEPDLNEYSILNNAGSRYGSLTASAGEGAAPRLVWIDYYGGRVQTVQGGEGSEASLAVKAERSQHSVPAPSIRTLFALRGINTVRLSNDGRFLAASYTSDLAATERACVKIYDFEDGSFFSVKETGLKEAVVVKNSLNEWFLLAQKYSSQHYSIAVYRLLLDDQTHKIKSVEPYTELVMEAETNPYAFTPLGNGTFAWLKKSKLSYSLCISKVDGSLIKEYSFPQGMVVRSLSYSSECGARAGEAETEASGQSSSGIFFFSYAQKGTMPRLGTLNAEDGKLFLSDADISGAVFEPLYWQGQLVYVGEFFRQSRLLCMDLPELAGEGAAAGYETQRVADGDNENPPLQPSQAPHTPHLPSKPYISAPYLLRGILIPVSSYSTDYFGTNANYTSSAGASLLGFTYITANPWTEGSSSLYTLTGGWNSLSNSYGLDLQINSGSATSLLQTFTELKSEFDSKGWKQGGGNFTLSVNLDFSNYSSISLANAFYTRFGRQDKQLPEASSEEDSQDYLSYAFWDNQTIGITAPEDDRIYFMLQNVSSLTYSNIRRTGPGRFEYAGFGLGLTYGLRYDSELTEAALEYLKTSAAGAVMKIYIPHLLPIKSKYGFTYNLPLRLTAAYNPSTSIYGYTQPKELLGRALTDAYAETTLFGMDIQKAIPGITAFYLNDFYVSAGYAGTLMGARVKAHADEEYYYLDSVYVKTALEFTPNIGIFARPAYKISLTSAYSYVLHSQEPLRPENRVKLFIGLSLSD